MINLDNVEFVAPKDNGVHTLFGLTTNTTITVDDKFAMVMARMEAMKTVT